MSYADSVDGQAKKAAAARKKKSQEFTGVCIASFGVLAFISMILISFSVTDSGFLRTVSFIAFCDISLTLKLILYRLSRNG